MISIGILSLLITIPLYSYRISSFLFHRITIVIMIFSAILSFHVLFFFMRATSSTSLRINRRSLENGIAIYHGLFRVTLCNQSIECFIYILSVLLLFGWNNGNSIETTRNGLMVLFSILGASFLLSRSDLVSMYLSIELQSFALYLLATGFGSTLFSTNQHNNSIYGESNSILRFSVQNTKNESSNSTSTSFTQMESNPNQSSIKRKNRPKAVTSGLKYFLLGGLSSALLLLGSRIIYSYRGSTQLGRGRMLDPFGMTLVTIGFLFKIGAAPFYNWAPDVYDGVPTIVTSWITTLPKISIGCRLLEIVSSSGHLLLLSSILSLIIGRIVGLSQSRIKRLLAFSSINHVGFLLLALSISTEESIESFLFYLFQYSITNVNVFLILLRFGILRKGDIQFTKELRGQFYRNPILSLSFRISLFSMAGIPPLLGFFAKLNVLSSSIDHGYYFLSRIAILVSVISASYYLQIIKILFFESSQPAKSIASFVQGTSFFPFYRFFTQSDSITNQSKRKLIDTSSYTGLSNLHTIRIAITTLYLMTINYSLFLNRCRILSLSIFTS